MTQSKRIIINILATYGRSLFSLACGLFTGRWVLEALGTTSYGVFGVVGTIIGLVTVVNQMLSSSVGRYFAFAVGKVRVAEDKSAAIAESREWFNTAIVIHTVMPLVLVAIGYPLGEWAIRNYFSIPSDMVETSVWVFRFSLITTFVGMCAVPFRSLYIANQYIAELTIYSVGQTAANVIFAWLLLSYPGDRLLFNAFYMMLIAVVPELLVAARCFFVFPECRIIPKMMRNRERYHHLFAFAGWQVVGWIGLTMRFQGLATLCNKALGLQYNSSMTVSNTVSQHAMTFSYALNGAFAPAITNAAGAGDTKLFHDLSIRSCKFGSLLCAIFVVPLAVEIHYVIHLWLSIVPPDVEMLCAITLYTLVIERMAAGLSTAIYATANIRLAEILGGLIWAGSLALGFLFVVVLHLGLLGIGLAILVCTILQVVKNVVLGRSIAGISARRWTMEFAIPFVLIILVCTFLGGTIGYVLKESFERLLLSTVSIVGVMSVASYKYLLDADEINYLKAKILSRFKIGRNM